ncbi:hypothetical protein PPERSA_00280 [Pseudocohnilembus persalinus]|uniref:Uncharacterized protein n=1 Tax=Pseudocohnilembus persalinus TaxID=266149 RepID=A0A0V0Q9I6_PSEPJ|nr:hypothetical protein PPERSA_00280 [Pseudocohnilembus persalinus]|eukprot:KRW98692.1 hypothetical protein PPERSA_00280 [Pseudocohnilembus persalinus]
MDILKTFLPDVNLNEQKSSNILHNQPINPPMLQNTQTEQQTDIICIEKKPSIYTLQQILQKIIQVNQKQQQQQKNQYDEPKNYIEQIHIDLSFQDLSTAITQKYIDNQFSLKFDPTAEKSPNILANQQDVDLENIIIVKPLKKITYKKLLTDIINQINKLNDNQLLLKTKHIGINLSGWGEFPNTNYDDNTLGYKNPYITQISLDHILNTLLQFKGLKKCDLNLSSFGIIGDYETKKFYTHNHVIKLCQFLYQNPDLEEFSLSARSYQANFDQFGTLLFIKELSRLKSLNHLVLKLDYFSHLTVFHFQEIIYLIEQNKMLQNVLISCSQSAVYDLKEQTNNKQAYDNYLIIQKKFFQNLMKNEVIRSVKLCDQIVVSEKLQFQNKLNAFEQLIQIRKRNINIFPYIQKQPQIGKIFRKEIICDMLQLF